MLEPLKYYIRFRGRVQGPFTVEELVERHKRGQFGRHCQVSTDGQHWERASQHSELFPTMAPPAKPAVGAANRGSEVIPLADDEPEEIPLADAEGTWNNPSDTGISLSEQASGADEDQSWYYAQEGRETGPVAFAHLQFLVANGELGFRDFVWSDDLPSWTEVRNVPGLLAVSTTSRRVAGESQEMPAGTSPLAVASFVFGLLGTSLLFCLGSIAAVVLGHIALKQIGESGGRLEGRGLALAGLVLGYVVLVATTVVGIVVLLVSALQTSPAG